MATDLIPQLREIVTYTQARERGLRHYFTGKPCMYGHVCERQTTNATCIQCRDDKCRTFYKANKDRINISRRNRNAANRILIRKQKREHRLANLEQYRERDRRVFKKFRTKNLLRSLKWQKDNPDRVRATQAKRRALKNSAPGHHTALDIKSLLEQQKGLCAYCACVLLSDYHVDHFMPLSRGGSNWPDNLRISCQLCNNQKYNRDPFEFLSSREKINVRKLHVTDRNGRIVDNK